LVVYFEMLFICRMVEQRMRV